MSSLHCRNDQVSNCNCSPTCSITYSSTTGQQQIDYAEGLIKIERLPSQIQSTSDETASQPNPGYAAHIALLLRGPGSHSETLSFTSQPYVSTTSSVAFQIPHRIPSSRIRLKAFVAHKGITLAADCPSRSQCCERSRLSSTTPQLCAFRTSACSGLPSALLFMACYGRASSQLLRLTPQQSIHCVAKTCASPPRQWTSPSKHPKPIPSIRGTHCTSPLPLPPRVQRLLCQST